MESVLERKRILEIKIRERKFIFFLVAHLIIVCINAVPRVTYAQELPMAQLSETEILVYLPEGAKLADVPFVQFGPDEEIKKTRQNVFYADVDDDGEKEIIVAYYTPPHEYIINDKVQKGFFTRAHVKVLDWDGTKYVEQWDSGGWGFEFRAGMGAKLEIREQQLYTDNYFNVGDINNDGKPEILFTRASFGADGSEFQALSWNGKTYEPVAIVQNKVRMDDKDNDGIKEIICDYDYKGIRLATPKVFRWNGSTYEMRRYYIPVREHGVSARFIIFIFFSVLASVALVGLILFNRKKTISRGR